jgi:uncharacterized protein YggE
MKRFVILACALAPWSLLGQGGLPTQPYIYVEGKAEVQEPADMVTLSFELVARAADEAKANADVQARANKVFDLAKARKIADEDVIASSLRSEPQFQNENGVSGRGKVVGYVVTRSFRLKVRDVPSFPKLADELIASCGAEFDGVEPGLQKEKEAQSELRAKAIENAREQAQATLQPMGMKIDGAFAISPVPIPEITRNMFPKDFASAQRAMLTAEEAPAFAEKSAPSQYRLAPITLTQIVHVIYLISPAK